MTITQKQREAMDRSRTGEGVYWPVGHDIASLRALARRGLLRETAGVCEGCDKHRHGTSVPVFEETQEMVTP